MISEGSHDFLLEIVCEQKNNKFESEKSDRPDVKCWIPPISKVLIRRNKSGTFLEAACSEKLVFSHVSRRLQ
jgi:hypothetical protein